MPFWDNVEGRPAIGHAPWEDYVPSVVRLRLLVPLRRPADTRRRHARPAGRHRPVRPHAVVGRRAHGARPAHDWYPPSADLTVHLFGEPRSEWLLAHLRARRASAGFASIETALWDPTDRSLVAHAAQVMYLVFPDGPPTGDDRFPLDQRPPPRPPPDDRISTAVSGVRTPETAVENLGSRAGGTLAGWRS